MRNLMTTVKQAIVGNAMLCVVPPTGSLIKFKDKHSSNIWYVRVDGFYDILPEYGGGRGVRYTFLGGQGNGSTPESHFEKVKQYNYLREMQHEIDNNLREVW